MLAVELLVSGWDRTLDPAGCVLHCRHLVISAILPLPVLIEFYWGDSSAGLLTAAIRDNSQIFKLLTDHRQYQVQSTPYLVTNMLIRKLGIIL